MLRVGVVGGSIGGLMAGLLLRDLDCDVEVYERSAASLYSRGAGIVAHPITLRYFVERAAVNVDKVTVPARRLRYVDARGAEQFALKVAYRFTAWNTFYRALRDCLDPERYRLGEAMTGFEQTAQAVRVRFASGREVECDLLVCADGAYSTARGLLLPELRPRYAGYVGWRGTVPESELGSATLAELVEDIVYQLLPSGHFLAYPIPSVEGEVEPGRRLINFVWYRNVQEGPELERLLTDPAGVRRESIPPGGVQTPFLEELRQAAEELAPALREAVVRCDQPFIQPIVDVEVPRMAFGRACLLGDAAFVIRPHAAAGTAKACANGWALADALADALAQALPGATAGADRVSQALAAWEPGQLELGRQVAARSREIGRRTQFLGTYRPEDPSNRFGLWGPGN